MDLNLFWKSILIIVVGVLLIRFAGRRSISQMTISQTVIMISIGTLLIQPVSGQNIWVTFAVASILISSLLIIELIQMKWDVTEKFFTGQAKVVIENGILNEKNLRQMRLSVDKLEMRLRQNGIEHITDVQWATLEPSGQIGYLLIDKKKWATKEDINQLHETISTLLRGNLHQQNTKESNTSNLFSEIEGGHKPPPPEHLD